MPTAGHRPCPGHPAHGDRVRRPELERLRGRSLQGVTRLIDRARASGDLRDDFRHEDVVLILMANAGLIADRHGCT